MADKYWIKVWIELLSDPKIARLPDDEWRKFMEFLLLAGYKNDDGKLPTVDEMAWMLHKDPGTIENYLQVMSRIKVVHKDGNDWIVTKFSKRQETPAAERMRRMRERKKAQETEQLQRNSYGNGYGADSSSSSASPLLIKESLINKNGEIGALLRLYEQEIGTITKVVADKLNAAWEEYPHEWFPVAFDEAVRNNARKWAYIEAILKNWKAHGFQSKNGRGTQSQQGNIKRTGVIAAERARLAALEAARDGNE